MPATDAVAIVSDGCSRIGREVVRRLVVRSYAIVVVYLDDQRSAEVAIEGLLATNGAAVAVRADLSDELDVERLFDEARAAFGGVDAVIHTAARAAPVLYRHAALRLRRGGAIVSVSTTVDIAPRLAHELRERDVTVNGVPAGLEPPGAVNGVADLIGVLDRWQPAHVSSAP